MIVFGDRGVLRQKRVKAEVMIVSAGPRTSRDVRRNNVFATEKGPKE